jgi:glycosyltransferase involved in cell wall biosynthesis
MRVALVHDYLTQYGGAERVLDAIHGQFPDAPVYTSLYDPDHLPGHFQRWDIRTSPLSRIPGAARTHRVWLPIYPLIFGEIGRQLKDVDIVIADSSAWSHHAHPPGNVPTICYCHSPARFLYKDRHYLNATPAQRLSQPLLNGVFGGYRALDRRAAHRITRYIANSQAVAERIKQQYGIDAQVIYPPIETERFRPTAPVQTEDWFLVVSRLVPHKWIERAVRASTASGLPLKIIGDGRARADLMKIAGPSVEFLGALPDEAVTDHLQRCLAMILPGVEDFGMTSVEAQAAGRPVIAARGGGALETVIEGTTGYLFEPEDELSLIAALTEARRQSWDSAAILAHAEQFNRERFDRELRAVVEDIVSS